jgi:selenoprotein W-related protein
VPCGLLDRAIDTERALLETLGQEVESVQLSPGHGGVFEVRVDDEVVWDEEIHGSDPDLDLITEAVRERASTA